MALGERNDFAKNISDDGPVCVTGCITHTKLHTAARQKAPELTGNIATNTDMDRQTDGLY